MERGEINTDKPETTRYLITAKGYPSVVISHNGNPISYAEVLEYTSGPAVARVTVSLKEGDQITHTGDSMQMMKMQL